MIGHSANTEFRNLDYINLELTIPHILSISQIISSFSACFENRGFDLWLNALKNENFALDIHSLFFFFFHPAQSRDQLLSENHLLRTRVEQQSDQIHTLRSHIGVIRQQTVTFILNQMDTLHIQRDTEV